MKRICKLIIVIFTITGLLSCSDRKKSATEQITKNSWFKEVDADIETDHIPGKVNDDAADDPAIWYNTEKPSESLILGTNKKGGVVVYNLDGKMINYFNTGLPNNIDVRNNIKVGDRSIQIAAFSDRSDSTVKVCELKQDGELVIIREAVFKPNFSGEIYGFCLYRQARSGMLYAIANSKEGEIEQWLLDVSDGTMNPVLANSFKLATQTEGMVADDLTGILFIGEEDRGIWSLDLNEGNNSKPVLIETSSPEGNMNIKVDIEGLAIYYAGEGGYLVASSQGNNSYALFDRKAPNKYLGSFKVRNGKIDSTEETDGLEVLNLPLNKNFPAGIIVVQDGLNTNEEGLPIPQNFKLIRWDKLATEFNSGIITDTIFNVNNIK